MMKVGSLKLCVSLLLPFSLLPHAAGQSSAGEEFYVAFPKSSFFVHEVLRIFVTTQGSGNVFIQLNSLRGYNELVYLRPARTVVFTPPDSFEVLSKNDHNKGIKIHTVGTNQKISVSVMKHATASTLSGTYLALPPITYQDLNEYQYYVTSYFWTNRIPTNYTSVVVLVGNRPNSSVTVTPSQQVEIPPHFMNQAYSQTVINAGESYTVLIQPMETFHIESLHDLTGTRITSSEPLTVLGSHECADVPVGVEFCDYLIEQFPPTVTWGRVFLMTSLHSRRTGELYKIVTSKSLTSVKVKCVPESNNVTEMGGVTMLFNTSGESREFSLGMDRFCSVVANKPVLVVQYSLGYFLDRVGDPFMLVLPPIDQYSNNFTFTSPDRYNNHITIVVPIEYYDSNKIFLNTSTLRGWSAMYCSNSTICGYGVRLSVPAGTHRVRHTDGGAQLMVYVYGFEYHDGYGQIAGTKLSRIADICAHGTVRMEPLDPVGDQPVPPGGMTGTVQLCVDGVWTSVCGEEWSSLEAAVVCAELGYSQYGSTLTNGTHSSNSSNSMRWPSLASDIRCLQSQQRLVECVHSWDLEECPTGELAAITCYPRYIMTVNMSAASPMLHRAPNPATLTCEVALTGAFNDELAMEMTWSKDGVTLPGVPHHHTPDEAPTRQPNATVHFQSALTLRSLKPSDNGTYICSAFVVSRTERHPLSSPVAASLDIQVLDSENQLFQLHLIGVGRCSDWLIQSPVSKSAGVRDAVIQNLQSRCPACQLTSNHISDAAFVCFQQNSQDITFRARFHATNEAGIAELFDILREWVFEGPAVGVEGVLLSIDSDCEVVIESFNSPGCGDRDEENTNTTTTPVADTLPPTVPPVSTAPCHNDTTDTTDTVNTLDITSTQTSGPTTPTSPQPTTPMLTTPMSTTPTTSSEGGVVQGAIPDENMSTNLTPLPLHHNQRDTVVYVGTGGGIFVITILVLTIACVVIIISCLKFRKSPSSAKIVVSATTPFPISDYDDPVAENLEKNDLSSELAEKYLGLTTDEL